MISADDQRRAAVAAMGPIIRKRAKSVPNVHASALELPTEISAALDRSETEAGRLVSSTLVKQDLLDPTVVAVLAQLGDGACAGDPAAQYAFGVSNSFVVQLLTMVSIKETIKDSGAA